jgi:hypothetical protein
VLGLETVEVKTSAKCRWSRADFSCTPPPLRAA